MDVQRHATCDLDAFLSGDRGATDEALNALAAEHGMRGVTDALMVWCDTALKVIPRGEGPVQLEWVDSVTGQIHDSPRLDLPAEQWAGRLLAPRAADDHGMFVALVNSAPSDERSVRDHVGAMLQMTARIVERAGAL